MRNIGAKNNNNNISYETAFPKIQYEAVHLLRPSFRKAWDFAKL